MRTVSAIVACVVLSISGPAAGTRLTSSDNFIVMAPDQPLAEEIRDTAEQLRKEIALAWLGAELPAGKGRTIVTVNVVDEADRALTWLIDHPQRTMHSTWLTCPREAATGPLLAHEITHVVLATRFGSPSATAWSRSGPATGPGRISPECSAPRRLPLTTDGPTPSRPASPSAWLPGAAGRDSCNSRSKARSTAGTRPSSDTMASRLPASSKPSGRSGLSETVRRHGPRTRTEHGRRRRICHDRGRGPGPPRHGEPALPTASRARVSAATGSDAAVEHPFHIAGADRSHRRGPQYPQPHPVRESRRRPDLPGRLPAASQDDRGDRRAGGTGRGGK